MTPVLLVVLSALVGPGQMKTVPDDLVIKLERTRCFGKCPVYSVTIDASGNVTYDGTEFVRVEGRQTDRIPISRVAALLETAERISFFDLRNSYRFIRNPDGTETYVTDLPTTFVSITAAGRSKRVEDYAGAPPGLKELEIQIDEVARTKRWIRLDEPTLRQMVLDGWSPSTEELAELLRKALGHAGVVKLLLDAGANPTLASGGSSPLDCARRSREQAKIIKPPPSIANHHSSRTSTA